MMVGFSFSENALAQGMYPGMGMGVGLGGMPAGWSCKFKSCNADAYGVGTYAMVEKKETAVTVCKEKLEAFQKGNQLFTMNPISRTESKENKQANKALAVLMKISQKKVWAGCQVAGVEKIQQQMFDEMGGVYSSPSPSPSGDPEPYPSSTPSGRARRH
ncbi:MAG: hypothetical protein KA715_13660 [Xanthomonadaceae bacterium]|nr:hypothetical protein [Xanthomonadaceae bacterium]